MQRDSAETMAVAALAWLVEAEHIDAFLSFNGLSAGDLRDAASDPGFLGGVLDFVLQSDERVLACAAAQDCPPEDLARARAHLPGGDAPHWT